MKSGLQKFGLLVENAGYAVILEAFLYLSKKFTFAQ
jgi:hypothetical protein